MYVLVLCVVSLPVNRWALYRGAGVACKKGTLLVFDNTRADGSLDGSSSHQSCPVLKGEKVVVSRFIRQEACHLNKFFSKRKWNGNVFCEVIPFPISLCLVDSSVRGFICGHLLCLFLLRWSHMLPTVIVYRSSTRLCAVAMIALVPRYPTNIAHRTNGLPNWYNNSCWSGTVTNRRVQVGFATELWVVQNIVWQQRVHAGRSQFVQGVGSPRALHIQQ